MKLVVVKSNLQVLIVPNYRVFRITVIYVKLTTYPYSSGNPLQPQQPSSHFPNSIYFTIPGLLSQLQHSSKVCASLVSGVGGAVIAPGGGEGGDLSHGGGSSFFYPDL